MAIIARETPVTIRDVRASALDAVCAIENASFPTPWQRTTFEHEIGLDFSTFRVAVLHGEDTRVVGYICSWLVEGEVHILKLAVDPAHRRRGIGRRLVEDILEEGARRNAKLAFLEVRETNLVAQMMYNKLGFSKAGIRRGYYEDTGEDAVVLWRSL